MEKRLILCHIEGVRICVARSYDCRRLRPASEWYAPDRFCAQ